MRYFAAYITKKDYLKWQSSNSIEKLLHDIQVSLIRLSGITRLSSDFSYALLPNIYFLAAIEIGNNIDFNYCMSPCGTAALKTRKTRQVLPALIEEF